MKKATKAFHSIGYRVLVEKLTLQARIGILAEERTRSQPLRISIAVTAEHGQAVEQNSLMCYKKLTEEVEKMVAKAHIALLEDLAEMLATLCFAHPQARRVWLRLEKPEAVKDAQSVGIETTFERGQAGKK